MQFKTLARHAVKHAVSNTNESVYFATGLDLSKPRTIQAVVNERCNYRCRYCDFWRLKNYQAELDVDTWIAALGSLKAFIGRYSVQFAGGEPFIKKNFMAIPEYCASQGIDWGVITNGSRLTDALCQRIAAAAPLNVDISVDSANSEIHNFVRGKKNSLQDLESAIKRLRDARDKSGSAFAIRIKGTVHRLNAAVLPELLQWVEMVGADTLDLSAVTPWTEEVETELWLDDKQSQQQLQESIERLIDLKAEGLPLENSELQLRGMLHHFQRKTVDMGVSHCRLGLRDFHIRPNGDVISCALYEPLGNIARQPAKDIWRSAKSRDTRAKMSRCDKMGESGCANFCLASQQPFSQQIKRGMLLLKQVARVNGNSSANL